VLLTVKSANLASPATKTMAPRSGVSPGPKCRGCPGLDTAVVAREQGLVLGLAGGWLKFGSEAEPAMTAVACDASWPTILGEPGPRDWPSPDTGDSATASPELAATWRVSRSAGGCPISRVLRVQRVGCLVCGCLVLRVGDPWISEPVIRPAGTKV
jgi:hypothetical protein